MMPAARTLQPAVRAYGPVLVTAALLIACIGLAATLTRARSLGDPVHPDGWAITFRPPRGWQADPPASDRYGATVGFRESTDRPRRRSIVFGRYANPSALGPDQVCGLLARSYAGPLAVWAPVEQASLGPLPGARIHLRSGACIHAGVLVRSGREGEAYALVFHSPDPLDLPDLQLCEALARSVRLVE